MFEFENQMMSLLDEYYGDSKDFDQKKDIVDFIETYSLEIRDVINEMM